MKLRGNGSAREPWNIFVAHTLVDTRIENSGTDVKGRTTNSSANIDSIRSAFLSNVAHTTTDCGHAVRYSATRVHAVIHFHPTAFVTSEDTGSCIERTCNGWVRGHPRIISLSY